MKHSVWLIPLLAIGGLGIRQGRADQVQEWGNILRVQTADMTPYHEQSGALSFEAPTGWEARGRWIGPSADDKRFVVQLMAPDQKIAVQLQDGDVPQVFNAPNTPVSQFLTGEEFAQRYVTREYKNSTFCAKFQIDKTANDRVPDNMFLIANSGFERSNASAGLVSFTCQRPSGIVLRGIASAVTVPSNRGNVWIVGWLWHYLATEDALRSGYQIAQTVVASIRVNPQWVAEHFPQSRPRPQIPSGSSYSMSHEIQRFQYRQGQQADQVQQWGDILSGLAPKVCDNGVNTSAVQVGGGCALGSHMRTQ